MKFKEKWNVFLERSKLSNSQYLTMKEKAKRFDDMLAAIPLLWITFNWKLFKKNGAKGSCMCNIHPCLKDDEHIKTTMQELCDYIRENYDMEEII